MFLRQYNRGVLKQETVLRVADNDLRAHELKKSSKARKAEKAAAAQVHFLTLIMSLMGDRGVQT